MVTFCDILHEAKQKQKQTLESAQYGLEIRFKAASKRRTDIAHSIITFRSIRMPQD